MDKIYTGIDRAKELGFDNYKLFIESLTRQKVNWNVDGKPLIAFVDHGRWLVECECGDVFYAEPDEPAFCPTCGNVENNGLARPIQFPINKDDIEKELLKREISGKPSTIERLGTQAALFPKLVMHVYAPRNWRGESVDELKAQHKTAKELKKNG